MPLGIHQCPATVNGQEPSSSQLQGAQSHSGARRFVLSVQEVKWEEKETLLSLGQQAPPFQLWSASSIAAGRRRPESCPLCEGGDPDCREARPEQPTEASWGQP